MNWGQIIFGTVACFVALLGIAVIFDVPPKKLPWAMLGSTISCVIMLIGDEIGLDPLITNMAAGILQQKIDGAEVTAVANASKDHFSALLLACLPELKG